MNAIQHDPPGARLRPEEIAARSGSNFLTGFLCLDAERRAGMTAIYAFCRVADDAVDDAPDIATGRAHLQFWRDELRAAATGAARTPVGRAVQRTMTSLGLQQAPLEALLDGVAMDLEGRGLADEAELRLYCSRVASAVGHACLPVLGATSPAAVRFADSLGQALQLTNILRDLRGDAETGRIYVPRTWLAEHGVAGEWLRGSGSSEVYAARGPVEQLCLRLASAAATEFSLAREHLLQMPRVQRRALVPARIMGAVYQALLQRLRRRGGDLRGDRVRVPRVQKVWLALRVWAGVHA